MRFTLRQIEYFVATAETGSITLASARVNISQPSISAAIAALEESFGIQLFIRHHAQGLSLTQPGERFLREARALLMQAGELESAAGALSTRVGGELPIGCLVTVYPLLVPELISEFRARHPSARVRAVAANQAELMDQLRRGDIALALTYDMTIPADIDFIPLAELAPFAFVAARHRLGRRRSVALAELAAEPFLLLDLPLSRDYFLSLFHQAGVTPAIAGRFEHIDVIRGLVARGEGFGLANAQPRNRASLDGHRLSYLALDGDPTKLAHGIAMVKGLRPTQTTEAFIALCRDVIRNDRIPGTVLDGSVS